MNNKKLVKLRDVEIALASYFDPKSLPSRTTIVGWIEDGTLEGVQIGPGRNYYVTTASLEKFISKIQRSVLAG